MKYLKYMLSVLVISGVVGGVGVASAAGKPPVESEVKKMQAALPAKPSVAPLKARRLLILDMCKGYAHGCIPLAGKTFEMMGKKSGAYEAVTFTDMSAFDATNLAGFDAVLFNNNTKLPFNNPAHRKALLDFIKSGKGVIGIHAASDNFYTWPEMATIMGGQFDGHPWRANGTWAVKLDDPSHPVNKGFGGKNFSIRDEIYQIKGSYSRDTHRVLLSLDMAQEVNRKVKGIKRSDNDFAIAWIKPCGKGRVFYSSLGHNNSVYWNPAVLQHYLDGIQYALGDLKADDTPSAKVVKKIDCNAILGYEFGGDKTALGKITASINGASPVELAEIERELVKVLGNEEATAACKQFVCRMLRRCGTEASVPALAQLLGDKELSHMARFALQGVDSPKVDIELRKALSEVNESLVSGIICTLGQRRDAASVPLLVKLLSSENQLLATASAVALGRIGTVASTKALLEVTAVDGMIVNDALLTSAEHLNKDGNRDASLAIYKKLYNSQQSSNIQVAALRGLVLMEKAESLPLLITAMEDGSPELKIHVASMISELPAGVEITRAIAKPLPTLSPDVQAIMIRRLTERADSASLSAITTVALSSNVTIKVEALRALGILGDAESLPVLLDALNSSDTSVVAAESLRRMNNPAIGTLLISEFKKSDSAATRCNVIEVLASRSDRDAMAVFIAALKDPDANVSKAGSKALGALGSASEVTPILDIIISTESSTQRLSAEKALSMIAVQCKNSDAISLPVGDALKTADQAVAKSLINILKRCGGQVAMLALQDQITTDNATQKKDIVRALASWKDSSPAETLLQIAVTEEDESTKILALRGYTTFASKAGGTKGVDMCRKALDVAVRPDDKKVVLGILGSLAHRDALTLVEQYLDFPEYQVEAENAYSSIANTIIASDPMAALIALQKVSAFPNADLAENAKKEMSKLKAQKAFITAWMLSGPYTKEGVPVANLIDTVFPPEDSFSTDVKWVPVKSIRNGEVLLEKEFGGDSRVAYMLTTIVSDKDQDARLEMGSDDGIKVWLNGQVVHNNNAIRGYKAGSDKSDVKLKVGKNPILVKITQGAGHWSGSMRISGLDGALLTGITTSISE